MIIQTSCRLNLTALTFPTHKHASNHWKKYLSSDPDKRCWCSPSKQIDVIVFWWFENPASSLPPPKMSQTLIMLLPTKTICKRKSECKYQKSNWPADVGYSMWPLYTVNTRLKDTPPLRTLAIMDKIQIPGESYRRLTGNDSHYYKLSLLRTLMTILLFWLFSYNIIM